LAVTFAALGGPLLAAAPAGAQNADNAPPTIDERLEAIDQRVRIIDRQRELEKEAADAKAAAAARLAAGKSGFSLTSADTAFVLRLRGYTHVDGRFITESRQPNAASTFLVRRARPIIEGTVWKSFDFRFMLDFGGGTAVLQDGHLDARFSPHVKLRAGKFKPPFGIERLQSATEMLFIERGMPTNLGPNRDVGIQLYGDVAGGALGYAAGVFNGVADGGSADLDTNNGKEAMARLTLAPFKSSESPWLSNAGLAIAASTGDNIGTPTATGLAGYRAPSQQTFFSYRAVGGVDSTTVVANGRHFRLSPQATLYAGRWGFLGEFASSKQAVRLGKSEEDLKHEAWQATASFVVTGETPTYKAVSPKKPFDRAKGEWGAFEITGRYGVLTADAAAFPKFANPTSAARRAESWGAGVNWYLNKNVKLVVDFDQTQFDGGARSGDRATEKTIGQRFQLSF